MNFVPLNRAGPEVEPKPSAARSSPVSAKPPTTAKPKKPKLRARTKSQGSADIKVEAPVEAPVQAPVSVPTQHRDNAQRRHTKHVAGAYRRLGITPEQMRGVPRISHLLAHAEGGLPTVLAALRLCDDADAGKFLDRYDALSDTDLECLTVEEIAVAVGVQPKRLLELAVSSLVEDSKSAGAIIAASYHPKVIRATAEYGINFPIAEHDRKVFLQGTGFLPAPSNRPGGVFVQVNNANAMAIPGTAGEEADDSAKFNAAEDDLQKLHEVIDGSKLLQAPKTVENASQIQIGHVYKDAELECVPVPVPGRK